MRFVFDVHGKFSGLRDVLLDVDESIQVGDYGLMNEFDIEAHVDMMDSVYGNHRFIRGNHDNPSLVQTFLNFIPDGTVENIDGNKFMFVGGAFSPDVDDRTEGETWWLNEQVMPDEFEKLVEVYAEEKPDVMVTHDAPEYVVAKFFHTIYNPVREAMSPNASRQWTRTYLQEMLNLHSPKLWVFGHWHVDVDVVYGGVRFLCGQELKSVEVDLQKDLLDLGNGKWYTRVGLAETM